uniref:hypothetical protein n=1 Tax=uncultured Draconibacterium sp. TaxID=1573823 RepID=UPI003216D57E
MLTTNYSKQKNETKNFKPKNYEKNYITTFNYRTNNYVRSGEVSWDYPVKPGSEEWKNLETYQDKLSSYNIPGDILEDISTEKLVESCLKYPELRLIFTRNSLQQGYDYIRTIFNGFRELESRQDAGHELLRIYSSYNPENINNKYSTLERGRQILKITYIEILIAQYNILKSFNTSESQELLNQCRKKYKQKKNELASYSILGLQSTALIIARSQQANLSETISKFGEDKFNLFVNKTILIEPTILDEIIREDDKKSSHE